MKTACFICLSAVVGLNALAASESAVVERGAHQATWHKVTQRTTADGRTHFITNSAYHEIATGLAYRDGEGYQSAREILQIVGNNAVGLETAHKVIFSGAANVQGCIDLELPDGAGRLTATVLGVNLYDPGGQSLLIAELADTQGEMAAPNRVLYRSAMDTINAELSYSFHKWGVEQYLTLQERFSLPEGFDPETTLLEVWTEFFDPPAPTVATRVRHGMQDSTIDFHSMQMRSGGKAFVVNIPGAEKWNTPVFKSWLVIDNRYFVIESVRWKDIAPLIAQLPAGGGQAALNRKVRRGARVDLRKGALPVRAFQKGRKMQMAANTTAPSGLVLDWSAILTPQSTLHLKGGTTWYVSGQVHATNLVIEPTAVVKYTNGASIEIWGGSVDCRTEPYSPAIFTAYTDGTVGEPIATNATASGFFASTALLFHDTIAPLQHIRVSHATNGVALEADGDLRLKHTVFTHCLSAMAFNNLYTLTFNVQNALFYFVTNAFNGYCAGSVEHATFDICEKLTGEHPSTIALTNCLIARLAQWGEDPPITNSVFRVNDDSCFKTVGSSSHYLADNSAYRDIGVATGIEAEIRSRSTYGPVVHAYGTMITNQDVTLTPTAQRDADGLPDIGWHACVIDHAFGGAYVTNAIMTVTPGTVIATYTQAANTYGMLLGPSARLLVEGSPTNLARIVRYSTVQEIANTNWAGPPGPTIITPASVPEAPPESQFRFVEFSILAREAEHIYGNEYVTDMAPIQVSDSTFRGGSFLTQGPSVLVTNCLFEATSTVVYALDAWPFTNHFQNNLFVGGELSAFPYASTNEITFRDNLFDKTLISAFDVANSHNGYLINSNRLSPTGSTDALLSSITYHAGPLGRYYLATNLPLVDVGSVADAAQKGFYWLTSFTNQTLEANTVLNIGKLWMAFQTNNPTLIIDDDFDGDPNHEEDINGDGQLDSNETDWTNPNDWGFKILITKPTSGSLIP